MDNSKSIFGILLLSAGVVCAYALATGRAAAIWQAITGNTTGGPTSVSSAHAASTSSQTSTATSQGVSTATIPNAPNSTTSTPQAAAASALPTPSSANTAKAIANPYQAVLNNLVSTIQTYGSPLIAPTDAYATQGSTASGGLISSGAANR